MKRVRITPIAIPFSNFTKLYYVGRFSELEDHTLGDSMAMQMTDPAYHQWYVPLFFMKGLSYFDFSTESKCRRL